MSAALCVAPRQWLRRCAILIGFATAFGLGLLLLLTPRLGQYDGKLAAQQIGFIGCPALVCAGDPAQQLTNLTEFARNVWEATPLYLGWPIVGLALIALPLRRFNRRVAYVAGSLALMLLALALTAKGYVPMRYLAFMAGPLVVLAAAALMAIRSTRLGWGLSLLAMWLIVAQPISNTLRGLINFESARLASQDQPGYVYPAIGPGLRVAALFIHQAPATPPPVILVGDLNIRLVRAYFDPTRIDARPIAETPPDFLGQWLLNRQPIYYLDTRAAPPPGLLTETVGNAAAPLTLRRVVGADAATRSEIYRAFFPPPETLAENYTALLRSLPTDQPVQILVYPPNHTPAIQSPAADHPNLIVGALTDSWPPDPAAAAEQIEQPAAADVRVALFDETRADPQRRLEMQLNLQLYRLAETWFGPVRLLAFAGPGPVAQTIPVQAQFGGAFTLDSIDLLDPSVAPNGVARLRLNWSVQATASQPLKVFVHLFTGDHILAQRDGQPVGELRPTNTWQVGETIADQFAITIPPTAAPGGYQLRVGLYELGSGARWPAQLPDGSAVEFFVGGAVNIK